jgi:phosphatidylserine/phosphatidylglycerophosphate/cardiolipin synthase-like enzyme
MVEFRSAEACRELLQAYVQEWNAYSMDKLAVADFVVRPQPDGDCLWLLHQDTVCPPVTGRMFNQLLDQAQSEVWLIQDYAMPDRSVLDKIRELAGRGVRVNILFSGAYSHLDKFHYATGYRKLDLIRAGARLWEYGHPLSHLHYKAVIVDDRWFSIGSINFNFRSSYLSKELNIVFEGPQLGEPMLQNLTEMRAISRPITAEEAAGQRGGKYFLYYLLLFLGG